LAATDFKTSGQRQLAIYHDLINENRLKKAELAAAYNVTPRSIQRDINAVNDFLTTINDPRQIKYNPTYKSYELQVDTPTNEVTDKHQLVARDVLAIAKIVLASRAFTKPELDDLLDGLTNLIQPTSRKAVKSIIGDEKIFYTPVHHGQSLLNLLWFFSDAIRHQTTMTITYQRRENFEVTRTILPEAVIFSEYYFYIACYNAKHQTTLFYRADRIKTYRPSQPSQQITRSRNDRFNDGEFRKRIQFMYPGNILKVRFQFWGIVEAALDRFPTAEVVQRYFANGQVEPFDPKNNHERYRQPDQGGSVVIEAEVLGDYGVMMWLLSQGAAVKVLGPTDFVEKVKTELAKMQARYE